MANEHVKALKDIDGVDVVAICSRGIGRASDLAQQYQIPAVYDSLSSMYEKHEPDGVIVAVPELKTLDILSEACRFPWKILVEKPIGYNYEQAKEISAIVGKNYRNVFAALNRRQYSVTVEVINQLSKVSGSRIVIVNDQEDPENALADKKPLPVVENWMYANSIHLIDYFTLFCRGALTSVNRIVPWKGIRSEFVLCELEYDSGDKGVYSAYWNRPSPWSVSISTKEKWWEIRPLEACMSISRSSRVPDPIAKSRWDIEFKPGLRLQADKFIRHLKGDNVNLPDLRQSLNTMKLIKDIYEA